MKKTLLLSFVVVFQTVSVSFSAEENNTIMQEKNANYLTVKDYYAKSFEVSTKENRAKELKESIKQWNSDDFLNYLIYETKKQIVSKIEDLATNLSKDTAEYVPGYIGSASLTLLPQALSFGVSKIADSLKLNERISGYFSEFAQMKAQDTLNSFKSFITTEEIEKYEMYTAAKLEELGVDNNGFVIISDNKSETISPFDIVTKDICEIAEKDFDLKKSDIEKALNDNLDKEGMFGEVVKHVNEKDSLPVAFIKAGLSATGNLVNSGVGAVWGYFFG